MNKIRLLSFTLIICILSGCSKYYRYQFKKPCEDVILIQILRIEETEEVIFETKYTEILHEISALKCRKYFNDPPRKIGGTVIKVRYNNDSYELLSADCNAYFDGEKLNFGREYFDWLQFDELISKYVNQSDESFDVSVS